MRTDMGRAATTTTPKPKTTNLTLGDALFVPGKYCLEDYDGEVYGIFDLKTKASLIKEVNNITEMRGSGYEYDDENVTIHQITRSMELTKPKIEDYLLKAVK